MSAKDAAIPAAALRFLLNTRTPGVLATMGRSGGPVTSAVWFTATQNAILVSTPEAGTKASNVRRDGRVSFIVDARERPYRGVAIEGTATLISDPELECWLQIAKRYLGPDLPGDVLQRGRAGPRAVIEIAPLRVRTWNLGEE